MIYFVCFMVSLLFGIVVWNKDITPKKTMKFRIGSNRSAMNFVFVSLSAFPFFIISAIRYGIGTDYFYTYYPWFQRIAHGANNPSYEMGFYYLNVLLSKITENPQWLFVITSFITVFGVYFAAYKTSPNFILSISIFFLSYTYFISLNNVRQSLASALLSIAIVEYWKDNKNQYIVFVILAGLCHQVAFLFFVFCFTDKVLISSKKLLAIGACALFGGKIFSSIAIKLAMMIPKFSTYFTYGHLIQYKRDSISRMEILIGIVVLIYMCYVEYKYPKLVEKDRSWNLIRWNQMIFIALCGLDGIVPAMYRIVRVFTFDQFIFAPYVVSKCRNKTVGRVMIGIIVAMNVYVFINGYIRGSEGIFPYCSVLSSH